MRVAEYAKRKPMAKRVSIADREQQRREEQGIRTYTGSIGQTAETPPQKSQKRKGVMVQLPEDLVKWRDTIWRERLAVDDKAEKSQIVEEALRAYKQQIDAEGDPFLKP